MRVVAYRPTILCLHFVVMDTDDERFTKCRAMSNNLTGFESASDVNTE